MPSYHYRLESLLNIKKQLEKAIKIELGVAIQELELQKKILKGIQSEINAQENQYRAESSVKASLAKLKQRMVYISALYDRVASQKMKVNEEEDNVDKIRERLIEIMKEKKVLEKLKEKELDAFRKEQEKAGQLLVDELVSFRESINPVDDKGYIAGENHGTKK